MMQETVGWVARSIRHHGWAPITVFIAHLLATRVFNGYEVWPDLDIPMHFIGGVAMAFFLWSAFGRPELPDWLQPHTAAVRFLLALGWVGMSTVVWEFAEWSVDALQITHAQASLDDTMLDMFLGLLGGGIYLAIAYWRR